MADYLSWDELEDEEENGASSPGTPWRTPQGEPSSALLEAVDEPARDKLSLLMKERARLEKQLMTLLGKAPPSEEDRRKDLMFPMPIHTAETRLAERQAAREEQRARALTRRSMERSRLRSKEEHAQAEQKREAEREVLQAAALERANAQNTQQRHEDWLRSLRLEESIRSNWAGQRELALRNQQSARYRLRTQFEQHNDNRRLQALERLVAKRKTELELHARLDQRGQRKKDWRDDY